MTDLTAEQQATRTRWLALLRQRDARLARDATEAERTADMGIAVGIVLGISLSPIFWMVGVLLA